MKKKMLKRFLMRCSREKTSESSATPARFVILLFITKLQIWLNKKKSPHGDFFYLEIIGFEPTTL